MELKHAFCAAVTFGASLLIVPCGIETVSPPLYVPRTRLLIVPCGIETVDDALLYVVALLLLIVPCGIETEERERLRKPGPAFNRTLWN